MKKFVKATQNVCYFNLLRKKWHLGKAVSYCTIFSTEFDDIKACHICDQFTSKKVEIQIN